MITDEEIRKKCEEIWKVKNTWGLSWDELIRLSYVHGDGGGGRINGFDDKPEDVVYTSPCGSVMTRYMCSNWINDWRSFYHGFETAYRLLEPQLNLALISEAKGVEHNCAYTEENVKLRREIAQLKGEKEYGK